MNIPNNAKEVPSFIDDADKDELLGRSHENVDFPNPVLLIMASVTVGFLVIVGIAVTRTPKECSHLVDCFRHLMGI